MGYQSITIHPNGLEVEITVGYFQSGDSYPEIYEATFDSTGLDVPKKFYDKYYEEMVNAINRIIISIRLSLVLFDPQITMNLWIIDIKLSRYGL